MMVDLVLKSGTVAVLLLVTALLLRDDRASAGGRLGIALALGSIAHATGASGFAASPTIWQSLLIAFATGNVVVLWLFARALFDEAFRLRWRHGAIWLVTVGLSLINCVLLSGFAGPTVIMGVGLNVITLGFIGLTVVQAIISWSGDLVESRRRMRLGIVIAAAAYGAVNAMLQLAMVGRESDVAVSLNAAMFAAIVLGIAWALVAVNGNGLLRSAPSPALVAGQTPRAGADDENADKRLIDALVRLMADDRIYRYEGVTIGLLANRLAVPEYRLRRLINQRLGYRNFNTFLNSHRIAEARLALADPSQAEVPVITIALDAGFQSLGPFNRAFKATTGVTPSEYRRDRTVSA
jgi:AraC-like DNA-binding protein